MFLPHLLSQQRSWCISLRGGKRLLSVIFQALIDKGHYDKRCPENIGHSSRAISVVSVKLGSDVVMIQRPLCLSPKFTKFFFDHRNLLLSQFSTAVTSYS